MHTDVNEFDPENYYQEFGNTITSDNIRSLGWEKRIPQCKRRIHDYLLPQQEITTVALLLGGPGSGKSTLIQHLPEWKDRGKNSPIIVDDNASAVLESPEYLGKISGYGKKAEIYWVSCSLKEALERTIERYEKNRSERIHSLDKFSSWHFKDKNYFIKSYDEHKDNPDVSFTLLLNPKTSAEQVSNAGPSGVSIDGIQRLKGQAAYDYITEESRYKPEPDIKKEVFEALDELYLARQEQGCPIDLELLKNLIRDNRYVFTNIPRASLEQAAKYDASRLLASVSGQRDSAAQASHPTHDDATTPPPTSSIEQLGEIFCGCCSWLPQRVQSSSSDERRPLLSDAMCDTEPDFFDVPESQHPLFVSNTIR
jgi:hypothetical protein